MLSTGAMDENTVVLATSMDDDGLELVGKCHARPRTRASMDSGLQCLNVTPPKPIATSPPIGDDVLGFAIDASAQIASTPKGTHPIPISGSSPESKGYMPVPPLPRPSSMPSKSWMDAAQPQATQAPFRRSVSGCDSEDSPPKAVVPGSSPPVCAVRACAGSAHTLSVGSSHVLCGRSPTRSDGEGTVSPPSGGAKPGTAPGISISGVISPQKTLPSEALFATSPSRPVFSPVQDSPSGLHGSGWMQIIKSKLSPIEQVPPGQPSSVDIFSPQTRSRPGTAQHMCERRRTSASSVRPGSPPMEHDDLGVRFRGRKQSTSHVQWLPGTV